MAASTQTEPELKYWAFISYSSKDSATAKRLHARLETYRIPKELVGRPGRFEPVPKRLFPIFRDRDELPLSHDLGSSIQDALRASKYLIVLCSPHAAQSKWVNEEVRFFKSLGREDRILAVIVSGIPNASESAETETLECFPPALRYQVDDQGQMTDRRVEPIGGDLRRGGDGLTSVLLKAVAGITGIGYDAFAKREAKRARRKRIIQLVGLLLCLCLGIWYWDYSRLKVHYFGQTGEVWGIPHGISPLTVAQQSSRGTSFRIESRGYKVRRVETINGLQALIDQDSTGAARTDLYYREDGTLERTMLYDRNGKLVTQKSYSKPGPVNNDGLSPVAITFLSKSEFAQTLKADSTSLTAPSATLSDSKRTDITAYQGFFSPDGRLHSIYFRNAYGSPIADANGVYGKKYIYDVQGLVIQTINLDATGMPMPDGRGVQSIRRSFGVFGSLSRQIFLDADDRPILGPDHVAVFQYALDELGNQLTNECLDESESPTLHKDGYHRQTWQRDAHGNTIAGHLQDTVGNACLHRYGFASSLFTFDSHGHLSGGTYLGSDGKPTLNKNGVCALQIVNDAHGNPTKTVLMDVNGQRVLSTEGWSKIIRRYDGQGNQIETSLFDSKDKPTLSKVGVWKSTHLFDDRGNRVQTSYFGIDGEPCINRDGIATERITYDELSNAIEISYLGVDGLPTIHKLGMAKENRVYDKQGNIVETAYSGIQGEPVLAAEGFAKSTRRFDQRGNLIEISYFDKSGQLALNKQGFARQVNSFNENGHEIRRDFLGSDGRPTSGKRGAARIEYNRDRYGRELESRLYDRNYLPMADENGIHRITAQYDLRGNAVWTQCFGPTGSPVAHDKHQAAQIRITYDARDREVDIQFFDVSGQPTLGGKQKVARRILQYDARGNVIEERNFGVDGKPMVDNAGCAHYQFVYDEYDNRIWQKFFGIDGQPTEGFLGIASTKSVYDAMSREVEQSYFDVQNQLTEDLDGVARLTQKYNARSQIVEQNFFDADNQLTIGKVGAARVEMEYDAGGNIVEHRHFGIDGRPKLMPDGMASYSATYDSRGQVLTLKTFGVDGQPIKAAFGSASVEKRYDRQGRLVEEISKGTDGKLARAKGNYARMFIEYDQFGNLKQQTYFDENNQLTLSFEGIARAEYRTDALGNLIEVSCFGVDGKLAINTKDGYARLRIHRDEQGRVLEQGTYGTDDKPIVASNGWAIVRNKYDASGRTIETIYFGADGTESASKEAGVVRANMTYDDTGRPTSVLRFGLNGAPLPHSQLAFKEQLSYHPSGTIAEYDAFLLDPEYVPDDYVTDDLRNSFSSHVHIEYDDQGRCLHQEKVNLIPANRRSVGSATQERQLFDTVGHRIGTDYLDADGKLAIGPNGVARDRVTLDQYGREVRAEGFDVEGKRVKEMTVNGIEIHSGLVTIQYDALNRPIEYLILDENDQPVVSSAYPYKTTYEYRRSNKPLQYTQHFNLPPGTPRTEIGSPPIRGTVQLDANGKTRGIIVVREVAGSADQGNLIFSVTKANSAEQVTELHYEDQSGDLTLGPDGIARQTFQYDRFGKISSQRFYNLDGPMIHPKLLFAGTDTSRDDRGNESEVVRIGMDGKPLPDAEGIAITKRKWDEKSRILVEAYYDANRKMVRRPGKFAGVKITYNDQDGSELQQLYDENSRPFMSELGYAKRLTHRDKTGNVTSEQFFDLQGQLVTNSQGYAVLHKKYDSQGRLIEEWCEDAQGADCDSTNGYCRSIRKYAGDMTVEIRYLDHRSKPAEGPDGFATMQRIAAEGQLPQWRVLAANGQPAACHVVVQKVMPNSQAEQVGIQENDILVSYNQVPVKHIFQLIELTGLGDEEVRTIDLVRQGKPMQIQVAKGKLGAALRMVKYLDAR